MTATPAEIETAIDKVFDEDAEFPIARKMDQFGWWIGRVCATIVGPRDIVQVNRAVEARLR